MRQALETVLAADLPNLVQMDVTALAGLLAERLLHIRALSSTRCFSPIPGLEAVEAAIKFARGGDRPGRISFIAATPSTG